MWLVYWESIMLPDTQIAPLRRELWGFWVFVAIITVKERSLLLYMNIDLTKPWTGDSINAVLTNYPIGCVGIMDVISSQRLVLIDIVCHFILEGKSMILARDLEHLINSPTERPLGLARMGTAGSALWQYSLVVLFQVRSTLTSVSFQLWKLSKLLDHKQRNFGSNENLLSGRGQ